MKKSIKVILADDHAVVRAGIRQFLEQSDHIEVIAEAEDGEAAQELVAKHSPDVVVLDVQMPKMTGIQVAEWVHREYPAIGILILTAYDEDPFIQAAIQAGANGYVLKTSSPTEIIRAVMDVNEGKSVLDYTLTKRLLTKIKNPQEELQVEKLSPREIEVLVLVSKGLTNKAIGVKLAISNRTVQGHIAHIFRKLTVSSRTEAVMVAISRGWITPNYSDDES